MPLTKYIRILGYLAIAIAIITWVIDYSGMVEACPYCRSERTIIGLLGVLMILPFSQHWVVKWLGATFGFLGAHIASAQLFDHHIRPFISHESSSMPNTLMATAALSIIIMQVWILFSQSKS